MDVVERRYFSQLGYDDDEIWVAGSSSYEPNRSLGEGGEWGKGGRRKVGKGESG